VSSWSLSKQKEGKRQRGERDGMNIHRTAGMRFWGENQSKHETIKYLGPFHKLKGDRERRTGRKKMVESLEQGVLRRIQLNEKIMFRRGGKTEKGKISRKKLGQGIDRTTVIANCRPGNSSPYNRPSRKTFLTSEYLLTKRRRKGEIGPDRRS